MSGVIQGGWEFVIAAYAVSGLVLAGYTASVFLRLRSERLRNGADETQETHS